MKCKQASIIKDDDTRVGIVFLLTMILSMSFLFYVIASAFL